jgi:hypothetical protein
MTSYKERTPSEATEAAGSVTGSLSPSGGRLPDFFVVGHPKSGTSALYRMLSTQRQVYMPEVKEPSFFVPELRIGKRSTKRYPETIDQYEQLFVDAAANQVVGEATTAYLWSRDAARRIAELRPDAKIIAILREPASYLRSLHLQFVQDHVETETDLRHALALEPERREGRSLPKNSTRPQWLLYSEHVRYVEQLQRYRDAFSAEQMLILIYDDYRADNLATIARVLEFLGLELEPATDAIEANPAVRIRSPQLYGLVRSLYLGRGAAPRAVKSVIKAATSQRLRRRALAAHYRAQRTAPRPADDALAVELRRRFKGEVEALSEYLERDLVQEWGYADL